MIACLAQFLSRDYRPSKWSASLARLPDGVGWKSEPPKPWAFCYQGVQNPPKTSNKSLFMLRNHRHLPTQGRLGPNPLGGPWQRSTGVARPSSTRLVFRDLGTQNPVKSTPTLMRGGRNRSAPTGKIIPPKRSNPRFSVAG